jgi:NifU-like protein
MAWEYSEKTKQLFMDAVHGKPGTHLGEIEDPDGLGEHGSIACGDALRFTFRVERNREDPTKDIITEARYLTFGCTSAIAASEALCAMIEAKKCTPIESLEITNEDIVDYLEGLPEQKIHCSVMGAEALEAAVYNWAQRRGVDLDRLGVDMHGDEQEEGRIVCKCFSLTEPYLKRKIRELNLRTIPEISAAIKAGGACTACQHTTGGLQDILDEIWSDPRASVNPSALPILGTPPIPSSEPSDEPIPSAVEGAPASKEELSPYQFSKKVEKTIEENIRPMLQRDGGDLEIIDIKDRLIYVRLQGACANCAGAQKTLKLMVETRLKERVDERIRIIQV